MGKNHRCRYRFVGCNGGMFFYFLFFIDEKEKCREKQLYSTVNAKVI